MAFYIDSLSRQRRKRSAYVRFLLCGNGHCDYEFTKHLQIVEGKQ